MNPLWFPGVALVLLLAGCTQALPQVTPRPPSDADRDAIMLTAETWNRHQGLPSVILDDVREILVTYATSAAETDQLCSAPAYGCAIDYDTTTGLFAQFYTPTPLIVIAPMPAEMHSWIDWRESLIVHEAVHHIGAMAGVGGDALHQDPARWCRGTCAPGNGVEGDAREVVRAHRQHQ